MDIKEFKEIHEYINSCIDENNDQLISLLSDLRYDLVLIKEKLDIEDEYIVDKMSGN